MLCWSALHRRGVKRRNSDVPLDWPARLGDYRTGALSKNAEDRAQHLAVLEGALVETEHGIVYIDRQRGSET